MGQDFILAAGLWLASAPRPAPIEATTVSVRTWERIMAADKHGSTRSGYETVFMKTVHLSPSRLLEEERVLIECLVIGVYHLLMAD